MACSVRDVAQKVAVWALCLFYSAQIVLMIVVMFFGEAPLQALGREETSGTHRNASVVHEYGV
ncbi:hypothetical protein pipiens_006712, partial [Culex pipiens pipiens]